MMSFLSFFALVIKNLQTKSDMTTENSDMDNANRGWYLPLECRGRVENVITNLARRGRGLRPSFSPQRLGRGLLALMRGEGRGLRPSSPPTVGRANVPTVGRATVPQISGSATPIPGGRVRALALLQEMMGTGRARAHLRTRARTCFRPPAPPQPSLRCLYPWEISPVNLGMNS